MGVDPRLDLALHHLIPLVRSTALNIIQSRTMDDAIRTTRCCCSWVTGHHKKAYWCGNDDGIRLWWKGEAECVTVPWRHAVVQAYESGLLAEIILSTYDSFNMDQADSHRWQMHYPYSTLTTPARVMEDEYRRSQGYKQ